MGVLERLRNAIRANIRERAQHGETPERQLRALLERLTRDYDDARTEIGEAVRDERRLRSELADADHQAVVMADKAKLALERDDPELAREAARRKVAAERKSEALRAQVELQAASVETLRDHLSALEAKLDEARRYSDLVTARQRLEAAQSRMSGRISGALGADALERIQDSVIAIEAAAQAAHDELENRLTIIEQKAREGAEERRIDAELEALRGPATPAETRAGVE